MVSDILARVLTFYPLKLLELFACLQVCVVGLLRLTSIACYFIFKKMFFSSQGEESPTQNARQFFTFKPRLENNSFGDHPKAVPTTI